MSNVIEVRITKIAVYLAEIYKIVFGHEEQ
jgi:hypothetical protein